MERPFAHQFETRGLRSGGFLGTNFPLERLGMPPEGLLGIDPSRSVDLRS